VKPDLLIRHPAGVHRDDPIIETIPMRLTLGDDPRIERRVAVPWHLDADVTQLGPQRLRGRPVVRVTRPPPNRIADFVTEMLGELGAAGGLDQPAEQLLQQTIRTSQVLRPLVVGEQLIEQLLTNLCRHHVSSPGRTPAQV
jgi:hypothetical protein